MNYVPLWIKTDYSILSSLVKIDDLISVNNEIDKESAGQAVRAIMTFLAKQGIVEYTGHDGYKSLVIDDKDLISVRTKKSGLFNAKVKVGCEVVRGQVLAAIANV